MRTAKHTPGPWTVGREVAIDYRPYHIVGADGGSLVAWCAGGGPKRAVVGPEERANAELIAAAPELLERAGDLIAILADFEGDYSDPAFLEALELLANETRAAIAKAEGRS